MAKRALAGVCVSAILSVAVSGCSTTAERVAYTPAEAAQAQVPGMPANIRFRGDAPAAVFDRLRDDVVRQAAARHESVSYLALSGGGGDGAFGAGFLKGLSETGRRPQFTIVSGVSTGALMAPFVFLGSNYDSLLGDLYTSGYASTLIKDVNLLNGLFGNALVDSDKLMRLIKRYVSDDTLQRVAAEHRRGRRLLIATTNIDSQQSEVWDMGAIATSGAPNALALFQQVLAASASVPGLFPPRLIAVAAGNRSFQEMHVDGGTLRQLYVAPDEVMYSKPAPGIRDLYVLVNNKIGPSFDVTDNSTVAVGTRSLSTILKREGDNNVLSAYAFAARNHIGYHLAYVDDDIRDTPPDDPTKEFSAEYMQYLYGLGEAKGRSANPWESKPPFVPGAGRQFSGPPVAAGAGSALPNVAAVAASGG